MSKRCLGFWKKDAGRSFNPNGYLVYDVQVFPAVPLAEVQKAIEELSYTETNLFSGTKLIIKVKDLKKRFQEATGK